MDGNIEIEENEENSEPVLEKENDVTIESSEASPKIHDESKKEVLSGISSSQSVEESLISKETLQVKVKELTLENEKFKEEITTLKAENLELKLTKVDTDLQLDELKNEIETQKKQIERLTSQLKTLQTGTVHNQHEDSISLLSEPDYLHHGASSFQNLASFNLNNGSQDYMDIVDVKERLHQWKGWNMDMHGWRSIGMGPIVEF